jgi:Double zinc ribbon
MICTNCGFQNAAGDQFCGSCGKPLGVAPAPASAGPAQPVPATANAPDVICWKCGRRNPPGRSFCMQCGERLEVAGAASSAPAAAPTVPGAIPPAPSTGAGGGGMFAGRGRVLGIGAVIIAVVLLGVLAAAAALNLPGQHPVAALVESPSPSPLASIAGSPAPGQSLASILPGGASATPTAPATVEPTPTTAPTPPPTSKPTKAPTPTPTASPVTCATAGAATKWFDLNPGDQRTIPSTKDWCIRTVTFTNTSDVGSTGGLQLYLSNTQYFDVDPYGWLEASIPSSFNGAGKYSATVTYPKFYMKGSLYAGTVISLGIPSCTGTCNGSVHIGYTPIPAQPH